MPLAGYTPEVREIPLGRGNSFQVQGLSLSSLAVLIREHFPDLDAIADLFKVGNSFDVNALQPIVLSVVSQMPGLAANIIAVAAGEGDASDAAKLPGPLQVKSLMEICELTFAEVGGVGKGWGMLAALLKTEPGKQALSTIKKRIG